MNIIKLPQKHLVDEFCQLVRIDSELMDSTKMVTHLKKTLKNELKLNVQEQKCLDGINLVVTLPGKGTPLLLAAHMDTVSPGKDIRPAVRKDRIISTSPTILGADDKAAVAVFIQTLKLIKKHKIKTRPLEIVFTYGEETGLLGAKNLNFKKLKSKQGLCFDVDGDVGTIISSAPTYIRFELEVKGKAAHSGIEPEKGISAIEVLAHIIANIKMGRIAADTTANIGTIQGGRQDNIVPDKASISGELRSHTPERLTRMIEQIRRTASRETKKRKASFKFTPKKAFKGYKISASDPFLKSVKSSMKKIRIIPTVAPSNGGSDANIFNSHAIKTLNLSVGMENVHTGKEYIKIKNLKNATRFLLNFITDGRTGVTIE